MVTPDFGRWPVKPLVGYERPFGGAMYLQKTQCAGIGAEHVEPGRTFAGTVRKTDDES